MADEPMGDDGLTQRERRAQRSRTNRAKQGPTDWARKARTAMPIFIILAILVAGAFLIVYLRSTGHECPDHWHGTQAVFVPGGDKQGEFDTYHRIDWNSPVAPTGRPYYNFGTAPAMSMTMHMHQDGPEQGSAALGPSQFHFEGGDKCIGIENAFNIIDLDIEGDSVGIVPGTPLASANANWVGPYVNNGNQTLRFFLQSQDANGQWVWSERSMGDYLHYQMQDGEAIVLAFGHYSPEQIKAMQDVVPAPSSRPFVPAPTTSSTTTMADTTAPGNATAA